MLRVLLATGCLAMLLSCAPSTRTDVAPGCAVSDHAEGSSLPAWLGLGAILFATAVRRRRT